MSMAVVELGLPAPPNSCEYWLPVQAVMLRALMVVGEPKLYVLVPMAPQLQRKVGFIVVPTGKGFTATTPEKPAEYLGSLRYQVQGVTAHVFAMETDETREAPSNLEVMP